MGRFRRAIFPPGAELASAPLVFLSLTFVTILQIPAHFLMRGGFISIGILVNEVVAVLGVPLLLIALLRFDWRRQLPFGWPQAAVLLLVVFYTIGADIIIDYLTAASDAVLPMPDYVEEAYERVMSVSSRGDIVWKMVVLCVVPGICEEVFFRGFCQTSLAARWGTTKAIVITAILFAVLHGNPWYFHLYFLLGLVLGWVFAATGTLWASIFCHVLNNAFTFTNHLIGLKFPLEKGFGLFDTILLICGVFLLISAGALLRRPLWSDASH